jgi:hypothetical protein
MPYDYVDISPTNAYTFTKENLDKYVATHSYLWALDAIMETLRIANVIGDKEAIDYLRDVIWKQAGIRG